VNHHIDHSNADHGFAALDRALVVFGQSAVLSKPSKRTLDDPALRQDHELMRVRPFHNLDDATVPAGGPLYKATGIAAIRPDHLETPPARAELLDQPLAPIPILHVGRVDDQRDDKAKRVDDDMALSPLDFLARIVTSFAPFSAVFTDWLSMMAALGVGLRPSNCRTRTRSRS